MLLETFFFVYLLLVLLSVNSELMLPNEEGWSRAPGVDYRADVEEIFITLRWRGSTLRKQEMERAKRIVCGNQSISFLYNITAYEQTPAGTHYYNMDMENCIIKVNDTVSLTLYQMTTKQFPANFWIERVVIGIVGRTSVTLWLLYRFYVFAVLQNGTHYELNAEPTRFMKEIPYGGGYFVNVTAATTESDNVGVDLFGVKGFAQMDYVAKPGVRQGTTKKKVDTKETSTLKPRSRKSGGKAKEENEEESPSPLLDLLYVSIFIFGVLTLFILARCLKLLLVLFIRPSRPYHEVPVAIKRQRRYIDYPPVPVPYR